MNTRRSGNEYEDIACSYLEGCGMNIIARNYRKKTGEIDIIAQDNGTLVFVEVKYRRNADFGGAAFAINIEKQKKIRKTAEWFMSENRCFYGMPLRFDAVLIEKDKVDHIKDAW